MADQTYDKLRNKTTGELREIAKALEGEGIPGFANLSRDALLLAVCKATGVPEEQYRHATVGDKKTVKQRIRALKIERDAALEAKDSAQLSRLRRKIHRLKRQLRAASL